MQDSKTSSSSSKALVVATSSEHAWQTCEDEEGNTYYFNPITGESTWDPPECLQKEEEKGWIECRDDRGQTYYYNARTQETSWNIPIDQRPYAKRVDLESNRRNRKITGLIVSESDEKDIWMSKEELRAKSNDYILTTSDRLDLEKEQRAKKRKEIRAQIKEERREINRKIFKTWEPHIKEATVTGALNCSWKGFRVIHPKVYEMKELTALRLVGNALNDVPRKIGMCLPNLRVLWSFFVEGVFGHLRCRPGRTPITPRNIIIAMIAYIFCIFVKPSLSNRTDKMEKRLNLFRSFFVSVSVSVVVVSSGRSSNSPEAADTIKINMLHNTTSIRYVERLNLIIGLYCIFQKLLKNQKKSKI